MNKKYYYIVFAIPLWFLLYMHLDFLSELITYKLFGLKKGQHFSDAIQFFIYEVPKVFLLLILIVFGVGIIRSWFSPEKTRKKLEGKSLFSGNVLASLLGVVTPFCSCSAVPLFLGFVEAGIPLGVTFSFLIAAPMINEVAVILLLGLFGWETALIYVAAGLFIAITSGWIIGKLKLEKWIADWARNLRSDTHAIHDEKLSIHQRVDYGLNVVKETVSKVWLYIVIGIAVGAGAHGFVPQDYLVSLMGNDVWFSVPLSVLVGIPLYSNAAGIIPIISVLIEKGASIGTALAFMMSVIALSLPEIIILKKVLKTPLIIVFIGVVGTGIIAVGYLFNNIF